MALSSYLALLVNAERRDIRIPGVRMPGKGEGRQRPLSKGDQVSVTRVGRLGVAAAASLATIAAMLAATTAQASASGGSTSPAVRHYTGTPGVARLVPRHKPAAGASSAPRVAPLGARRLPSGHFSAAEAVPGAPAPASAAVAAAAKSSALVNFNGVSSRDSQVTNFEQMDTAEHFRTKLEKSGEDHYLMLWVQTYFVSVMPGQTALIRVPSRW